ncbi:NlpC/P60 family protein [Streptomyces sp. yara]|uniref:NlpC/P60 family protein n=1 Tax=Streptomyces sp. yara TaxID=3458421 RepID=UPI0040402442
MRRSPARRTALVVAAVASAALGAHPAPAAAAQDARVSAGQGLPADQGSGGGQGVPGPLFGADGRTGPALPPGTIPAISRTDIVKRAAAWVSRKVPYSVSSYWSDGYRQDCSGYVSMAWKLPGNEWTGSLAQYADKITKAELQPGDILLFHNASDPYNSSHVVIFGGWANTARTQYVAYEQTPPHTRKMTTPYAYWNNSARYVPYRYKGVTAGAAGAAPETAASVVPPLPAGPPVADSPPVTEGTDAVVQAGVAPAPAVPDAPAERTPERGRPVRRRRGGASPWTALPARRAHGPARSRTAQTEVPLLPRWAFSPSPPRRGRWAAPAARCSFRVRRTSTSPGRAGSRRRRSPAGTAPRGPARAGPRRAGRSDAAGLDAAGFQRGAGPAGRAADGAPGPETWRRFA